VPRCIEVDVQGAPTSRLRVGSSGFSYPAWKPNFYPQELHPRSFLRFYASRLDAVEINATFYGMPSAATVASWRAQVGGDFRFALKAPQQITHRARLRGCDALCARFYELASSLGMTRGPVLFQLPPRFRRDVPRLVSFLAALPEDHRAAFEFRHPSWFDEAVFAALREHAAALCIADTPELPVPLVVTAAFGYIRLRHADYTLEQLQAWRQSIQDAGWRETYVFFKHDEGARAPALAQALRSSLPRAA
jgi:uncharacterized protein YecE (DUF72 family)